MKIASIVPVKNIEQTFENSYAMLLTHLKDYYPPCTNKNCYRIMDNSLIELGGAVDIDKVYAAAEQCQAHEIILPDKFRDGVATIQSTYNAIDHLAQHGREKDFRLMAVCQGKSIGEFEKCFEQLCRTPEIHTIGIPKVAETLHTRGRPYFEYLWQHCNKEIHLLGCWTSLAEFTKYEDPAKIRSADTCIPALLACNKIDDTWSKRPEQTIDLLNDDLRKGGSIYWKHLDALCERNML